MAPPQLRGLLRRQILRDMTVGFALASIAAAAWWFGVARPRQIKYEEFYKNYDANAVAATMTASFEEKGGYYLELLLSHIFTAFTLQKNEHLFHSIPQREMFSAQLLVLDTQYS